MPKTKLAPEQSMTLDEACAFASGVALNLEGCNDSNLTYFVLILRWLAYEASQDDREVLYIETEAEYATSFAGVDDAIVLDMQKSLDALRQRTATKGGTR